MRKLGKVLHVSKVTRRLIVKSYNTSVSKGYVVDRTGYVVGRVDDVFGPIDAPYYAVKPSPNIDPAKYVGEEVFIAPEVERAEGKRRRR